MRISDWSSDVCSSDLIQVGQAEVIATGRGTQKVQRAEAQSLRIQPPANQRVFQRDRADPCAAKTPGQIHLHPRGDQIGRSEEHTSELQSLMRISYAVFCLKKKHKTTHKK